MTNISNLGAQVDLTLRQGADFASTLTFLNADGTPLDLTGYILAAQIRSLDEVTLVASFLITVQTPATLGLAVLALSAAITGAISCGESLTDSASQYVWDLELTDPSGKISSPLFGNVSVFREVTR